MAKSFFKEMEADGMQEANAVLKRPWCGWTQVVFLGIDPIDASYLTQVHIDLMDFIDDYFEKGTAELFLDSEGYDWNIAISNGRMDIKRSDIPYRSIDVGEGYMQELARNVYEDIMANLLSWITWTDDPDEIDDSWLDILRSCLEKTYRHGHPDANAMPDIRKGIREALERHSEDG